MLKAAGLLRTKEDTHPLTDRNNLCDTRLYSTQCYSKRNTLIIN